MPDQRLPTGIDAKPTRRQLVAAAGTMAVGTVSLSLLGSDPASAEVTMGELSVGGDDATLSDPPKSVQISVSGDYEIAGPSPPGQARTVLQIHGPNDNADDLDEAMFLDSPSSGTYSLSCDLFDHRDISQGDLLPTEVGQTASVDLVVRVILLAITDGSIQQETFVEDTATVALTKDGLNLAVGGTGDVTVQQA